MVEGKEIEEKGDRGEGTDEVVVMRQACRWEEQDRLVGRGGPRSSVCVGNGAERDRFDAEFIMKGRTAGLGNVKYPRLAVKVMQFQSNTKGICDYFLPPCLASINRSIYYSWAPHVCSCTCHRVRLT